MKRLLPFLFLLALCSTSALAQHTPPQDSISDRLYVGAGIGNLTYYPQYQPPEWGRKFIPLGSVQAGYWFGSRASVQVGFSYAVDRFALLSSEVDYRSQTLFHKDSYRTRVFAAELTGRYALTNPFRRLQLYAMASVAHLWSNNRVERSTIDGTDTFISSSGRTSGKNIFAAAGPGLSYRLNRRLEFYAETPILYHDLEGDTYRKAGPFKTGLNFRW